MCVCVCVCAGSCMRYYKRASSQACVPAGAEGRCARQCNAPACSHFRPSPNLCFWDSAPGPCCTYYRPLPAGHIWPVRTNVAKCGCPCLARASTSLQAAAAGPCLPDRRAHMAKGQKLADFSEGTRVSADTLLEMPCDVLIPAAIGGVITSELSLTCQQPLA